MEVLDKLQKRVCRTGGLLLASLLEPFTHRGNRASLNLFYRYYLLDVNLNWLNRFHILILVGVLLVIVIDCMIFQSPFLYAIRMFMSTVSFLTQLDSEIFYL